MLKKALTITGLTLMVLVASEPALAVAWGPQSTWYKGERRATGQGDFVNDRSTYALNTIKVTDDAPDDGNTVYGVTSYYFFYNRCDAAIVATDKCYDTWQADPRPEKSKEFHGKRNHKSKTFEHRKKLHPMATRARAETYACVQMGWPVPDGCAPASLPSFDY